MENNSEKNKTLDYHTIYSDSLEAHFEMISTLGVGAFGVVIEAKQIETGKLFALKVFQRKYKALENAMTEAKMIQKMSQAPNFQTFEDLFEFSDCIAIAT
jgi:serine/threonine protein kinase